MKYIYVIFYVLDGVHRRAEFTRDTEIASVDDLSDIERDLSMTHNSVYYPTITNYQLLRVE